MIQDFFRQLDDGPDPDIVWIPLRDSKESQPLAFLWREKDKRLPSWVKSEGYALSLPLYPNPIPPLPWLTKGAIASLFRISNGNLVFDFATSLLPIVRQKPKESCSFPIKYVAINVSRKEHLKHFRFDGVSFGDLCVFLSNTLCDLSFPTFTGPKHGLHEIAFNSRFVFVFFSRLAIKHIQIICRGEIVRIQPKKFVIVGLPFGSRQVLPQRRRSLIRDQSFHLFACQNLVLCAQCFACEKKNYKKSKKRGFHLPHFSSLIRIVSPQKEQSHCLSMTRPTPQPRFTFSIPLPPTPVHHNPRRLTAGRGGRRSGVRASRGGRPGGGRGRGGRATRAGGRG